MYQAFLQDVYNETKLLSEGYTDGYEDGQKTRKRARPEDSAGEETMLLFGALSSEIQLVRNEMMLLFLLLRDRHKGREEYVYARPLETPPERCNFPQRTFTLVVIRCLFDAGDIYLRGGLERTMVISGPSFLVCLPMVQPWSCFIVIWTRRIFLVIQSAVCPLVPALHGKKRCF